MAGWGNPEKAMEVLRYLGIKLATLDYQRGIPLIVMNRH